MTWAIRAGAILWTILCVTPGSAETVARFLIDAGWQNYESKKYSAAEELLEQAVRESVAAKNQPAEVAESRAKLAWLKYELNQLPAAAKLATAALQGKPETLDAARADLILAKTATSADKALEHLERARTAFESDKDPEAEKDPKLFGIYVAIAEDHFSLGHYSQAHTARSLRIDKRADPVLYLRSSIIASRAALALDRAESVELQLNNIESLLDADNERHLPLRIRLDGLGVLAESRQRQGDLNGAYQRLLQGRDEFSRFALNQPTADHTQVAQIVLQQAQVCTAQGRLNEALPYAQWLVALKSGIHPRLLAEGHAACGEIHFSAGRFEAARKDFQLAKDGHFAISGKSHPLTIRARLGLAKSSLLSGHQEQAAEDLRELVGDSTGTRVPAEPWLWLAKYYFLSGRFVTAVTTAGKAKELLEEAGATRMPAMLDLQWLLVFAHLSDGRLDSASAELDKLLSFRGDISAESDLWSSRTLQLQGLLELARGSDESATLQFQRSLEIWQRLQESPKGAFPRPEFGHPEHADLFLSLAIVEPNARESHWQSAYTMMSTRLPDEATVSRVILLASLCRKHGRDFDAIWLYEKARTIATSSLGAKHPLSQQIESELESLLAKHLPVAAARGSVETRTAKSDQPMAHGAKTSPIPECNQSNLKWCPSIRCWIKR